MQGDRACYQTLPGGTFVSGHLGPETNNEAQALFYSLTVQTNELDETWQLEEGKLFF